MTQPNTWQTYYTMTDKEGEKPLNIEGGDASTPGGHIGHTMKFNNDGTLASVNAGNNVVSSPIGNGIPALDLNGADPAQQMAFKLDSATQFAAPFEMTRFDEDGATTGFLSKVDFDEYGSVIGTYSNGKNVTLGRVGLVRVTNEQGLDKKRWYAVGINSRLR